VGRTGSPSECRAGHAEPRNCARRNCDFKPVLVQGCCRRSFSCNKPPVSTVGTYKQVDARPSSPTGRLAGAILVWLETRRPPVGDGPLEDLSLCFGSRASSAGDTRPSRKLRERTSASCLNRNTDCDKAACDSIQVCRRSREFRSRSRASNVSRFASCTKALGRQQDVTCATTEAAFRATRTNVPPPMTGRSRRGSRGASRSPSLGSTLRFSTVPAGLSAAAPSSRQFVRRTGRTGLSRRQADAPPTRLVGGAVQRREEAPADGGWPDGGSRWERSSSLHRSRGTPMGGAITISRRNGGSPMERSRCSARATHVTEQTLGGTGIR
jgi:hypothetical protein